MTLAAILALLGVVVVFVHGDLNAAIVWLAEKLVLGAALRFDERDRADVAEQYVAHVRAAAGDPIETPLSAMILAIYTFAKAPARARGRRAQHRGEVLAGALTIDRRTVSVVLAALNEEETLSYVLREVGDDVNEVVLVDDQSVDRTVEVARQTLPGIRVLRGSQRGYGAALACGLSAASGDIIVVITPDILESPSEISSLVEALRSGCDFARVSRRKASSQRSADTRQSGPNRILNCVAVLFFGMRYTAARL